MMLKEAIVLSGVSELAIMKLDVLDGLKSISVCTAYKYKGKILKEFPYDLEVLKAVRPVYKQFPGWSGSVAGARQSSDLPANAKKYLSWLEDSLKTKIKVISVGSSREETIFI
jgi:adenylosuccinate synthase